MLSLPLGKGGAKGAYGIVSARVVTPGQPKSYLY